MTAKEVRIKEEENIIHDNALDIFGNTFSFDHVKGLSEWLKNSVDAYKRSNVADKDQQIYIRFTDGKKSDALIECIDFNGMSEVDINKALKLWFDPEASKRGNITLKTFGGHGNGGKFYMRQMFSKSHYITYKNGYLNVFGFSENRKYGFADGLQNKKISPKEALEYAGLGESYISKQQRDKVLKGETGFTVVRGIGPSNMKNVLKWRFLSNSLANHPQSQRILDRVPLDIVANGVSVIQNLKGEKVEPYPGFELIEPILIPEELVYESDAERISVTLSNSKYPPGLLKLSTSSLPMHKGSKRGEMNRIDVLGEIGVIGSYKMNEIGHAFRMPQAVFIYGEIECPILEDPSNDAVQNDRSKLVENPTTKALLDWIDARVLDLCKKIAEKEQQERAEKMKDVSSYLNNYLNQWKDKFMSKILAEVLTGDGPGAGTGTGGSGGSGTNTGTGGGTPKPPLPGPDGGNDGGGDKPTKAKRSPKVLLSSLDKDPFPPFENVDLSPRQHAVYQRVQDVDEGIYWINTSAPLAENILKRFGQDSSRFRDYLFQRYVDIFIKEALANLEKNDPNEFNASAVEEKISEVIRRVHETASEDLSSFLFEDTFVTD
ncbi:MAG: hypothetical protein HZB75_01060 [Candidatus Saccharibacteria bacterium]|nr:MAG: hypothetical protein HZB75_01060 [Candidatus Saccharibacteria bacterium]